MRLCSQAIQSTAQAAVAHPGARHPLLLWNCLPRAGASQFHGHLQVALSQARHSPGMCYM